MAIAELTGQRGSAGGPASTTSTVTYTSTPTEGNLLVAMANVRGNVTPSALPSGWSQAAWANGSSNDTYIFWKIAGASESLTHNWTWSGSFKSVMVWGEWSGIATTSPVDKVNTNTGTIAATTTGLTGILSQANELIIAAFGGDTNGTFSNYGASLTEIGQQSSTGGSTNTRNTGAMAARIVSTTATVGPSADWSAFGKVWSAAVVTFKEEVTVTTHQGTAAFSGESSLTATGSRKAVASGSVSGESSLTATATVKKLASAAFSGDGGLSATGNNFPPAVTHQGTAAFSGQSTFTATATLKKQGTAAFSGQSTFTATGAKKISGSAAFSAEGAFGGGGGTDAALESENFLTGANGDDVGDTYGIFDNGGMSAGATVKIDTSKSIVGTRSVKFTVPLNDWAYRTIIIQGGGDATNIWFRTYMEWPTVDYVAPFAHLVRALRSNGTQLAARLSMDSAQHLKIQDNTTTINGGAGGLDWDDNALFDRFVRMEWNLNQGAQTQTFRAFWGNNLHGTTPDFEETGAFTDSTGVGMFQIGQYAAGGIATAWFHDAIGYSLTGWCGPAVFEAAGPVGTVTTPSVPTKYGDADFSAESSLTATGSRKAVATASFSGQSSLTATATLKKQGIASFSGQSSLTATGTKKVNATAAFSGDSSLTATATLKKQGTAAFSGDSSLTATATLKKQGTASFSGQSSLTATADVKTNATASFSSDSSMTADGTVTPVGGGGITIAAGTMVAQDSGPDLVVPLPTHSAGDILIVFGYQRATSTPEMTCSAGWTLEHAFSSSTAATGVFWKVAASSSETDPTLTCDSTATRTFMGVALVIHGADAGNVIDQPDAFQSFAAPSSPFDVSLNAVTTTNDGSVVLGMFGSGDDNYWELQTAGWTQEMSDITTIGNDGSMMIVSKIMETAGDAGIVVGRQTQNGGDSGRVLSFAINKGAGGPTVHSGSATFSGDSDLSATGTAIAAIGVAFSSQSSLTATGSATSQASAAFDATSNLQAAAFELFSRLVFLSDIHAGLGSVASLQATSALALSLNPDRLILAGDTADNGLTAEFADLDDNWGSAQSRALLKVIPGNHDYLVANAAQFETYWYPQSFDGPAHGATPGFYGAEEIGGWQIIYLNLQSASYYSAGSAQRLWLTDFLSTRSNRPMLAVWHYEPFSAAQFNPGHIFHATLGPGMAAIWDELQAAGCEIVIAGHDHAYQRFSRKDSDGTDNATDGMRSIVVATLNNNYLSANSPVSPTTPEAYNNSTSFVGVTVLDLYSDRYEWQFVGIDGVTYTDSGSQTTKNIIALVHSGSVAFSAESSMTASGDAKKPGEASLSGESNLTATATVKKLASSAFSADSSMTATATVKMVANASFSGASSMVATATVKKFATASFSGQSSLTASGTRKQFGSVGFSGESTLAIDLGAVQGVASLSSNATLTTDPTVKTFATAGLSAQSSLTASGTIKKLASSSLSADSSMTATALMKRIASAALSSESSLSASALIKRLGSVALSGESSITATALISRIASAALSADSSIDASATITQFGSATLVGSSHMSIDVGAVQGVAAFSSDATMTVDPTVTRFASASLDSDSSLVVSGTIKKVGSSSFSGASSMVATATVKKFATASFSGQSSLTASGTRKQLGSVGFSSQSSITASATRGQFASVAFSADSSIDANGTRTQFGTIALDGTSHMSVDIGGVQGVAAFSSNATMTVDPTVITYGSAAFSAESSTSGDGAIKKLGTSSFSADSSMSADGTLKKLAAVTFSADSSIVATSAVTAFGSVIFVGDSNLSIDVGGVQGVAVFSSDASMTLDPIVKTYSAASFSADLSIDAMATLKKLGVVNFDGMSTLYADAGGVTPYLGVFGIPIT